jgi:hypothetical protein
MFLYWCTKCAIIAQIPPQNAPTNSPASAAGWLSITVMTEPRTRQSVAPSPVVDPYAVLATNKVANPATSPITEPQNA